MRLTQVLMAAVVAAGLVGCGPIEGAAEPQPQVDETGEVQAASCYDYVGYYICPSDGSEFAYTLAKNWCGIPSPEEARAQCERLCDVPCLIEGAY